MTLARPLFLILLLAGAASSTMAADEPQSQAQSNSLQSAASDGLAQTFRQSHGLILSVAKAGTLNHSPNADPPLAKLDDGVCYTMRMYKLKRAERVAEGESLSRGYTTCEMASNYQYRSAVAHSREVEDLNADRRK